MERIQAITEQKDNKLVAIASTEDRDRSGDVLSVKKWDFSKFILNPVLQAGHDYRPQYTIGVAKNLRIEGTKVVFEPVFHTITPLAKQIKEMYEQGFLKAWSVGFIPGQSKEEKNELLEVSAVAVPANAFALMKGFSASDNELETEVKGWMDKALEDDHSVEKAVVTKSEVNTTTGETDGHRHSAVYDDVTGNGTTDEVNGHVHEIADFEVQEADGHTHTLDTAEANADEAGMGKKPKKKKDAESDEEVEVETPEDEVVVETTDDAKADEDKGGGSSTLDGTPVRKVFHGAWNPQLPAVLQRDYEVSEERTQLMNFENSIFTKFFDCQVKKLYVNEFMIPSPLLGTYLAGFKSLTSDFELADTRNWDMRGAEYPPIYGTIQLNSKRSDDFLLEGTCFYKVAGANGLVIKFSPSWGGMIATLVTHVEKRDWNVAFMTKVHEWVNENNFLRGEKFALSGEFIKKGSRTWDDIIADEKNTDAVKKSLKVLENKDNKSRGLLFIGPPGTGKTMTGKVLADTTEATFVWISTKDVYRIGEIGAIRLGFQLARSLAPSIIFMEDIDQSIRGYAVDLLKTEMDGMQENRGLVTILTSNNPEQFPDALIDRPGRFHEIIKYDLPTKEVRSIMIERWAKVDKAVADDMAERTEGFSGAHIKELVEYANAVATDDGLELKDALAKSLEKLFAQKELIAEIRQTHKSIDTIEVKVGRVISKKNKAKIEAARDALDEVLKIADTSSSEEKPEDTEAKGEEIVEAMKVTPSAPKKKNTVSDDELVIKTLQTMMGLGNKTLHKVRSAKHLK